MKSQTVIKYQIKKTEFNANYAEIYCYKRNKMFYFLIVDKVLIPIKHETLLKWKMIKDNYFHSIQIPDGNYYITLYQLSKS